MNKRAEDMKAIKEQLSGYREGLKDVLDALPLGSIEKIFTQVKNSLAKGKRIFIFGNGGSAATASHAACDLGKGTRDKRKKGSVICLNDSITTMLAYANDCSFEEVFSAQVKDMVCPGDVAIGISASGNSRNVIKAIELARKRGAVTVALTGFDGGVLAKTAKLVLIVPSRDMQKIEDVHLIVVHMLMQLFNKEDAE
jgi:D-sedoheptulose 7-phosphate isomerase